MSELYDRADSTIRRALGISDNIALCPMGECGLLTKQILNWRYGIQETYTIDNYMKYFNSNIISVDDLKNKNTTNLVIVLSTVKEEINWELRKQIEALDKDISVLSITDPIIYDREYDFEYIKNVRNLLAVRKVRKKELIRIGRDNDGGYVMLKDFSPNTHAYSFGIADDVSWDAAIAEMGLKVYMYDHTIGNSPRNFKNGTFYSIGISGKDSADGNVLSIRTILEKSGDIQKKDLLLKMDVEGAEWEFILETPSCILENFAQMTFEFHGLLNKNKQELVIEALAKLNKTHQVIWVHGNNAKHAYNAKGLILPYLLEATYVSKKKYEFDDYESYIVPGRLDMPNIPRRSDLELGNFGKSAVLGIEKHELRNGEKYEDKSFGGSKVRFSKGTE